MQTEHDKMQSEEFNIHVHGGNVQMVSATQGSTIVQNNYNPNMSINEILSLIETIKKSISNSVNVEDIELASNNLSVAKKELTSEKPHKATLRNAINVLKAVKGTAEFAAAVTTLFQFVEIAVK